MVVTMVMMPVPSSSLAAITSLSVPVMVVYMVVVGMLSSGLLRWLAITTASELASKALNQARST